jgi:DNA-directed RNA polymerase subunit H (RpoH/RPB5)
MDIEDIVKGASLNRDLCRVAVVYQKRSDSLLASRLIRDDSRFSNLAGTDGRHCDFRIRAFWALELAIDHTSFPHVPQQTLVEDFGRTERVGIDRRMLPLLCPEDIVARLNFWKVGDVIKVELDAGDGSRRTDYRYVEFEKDAAGTSRYKQEERS